MLTNLTEHPASKASLVLTPDHRYLVDGREVPGVTAVLVANSLVDYSGPWFTPEAKQRGADLHAFCALVNDGTIDWDGVPFEILPEVESYADWKAASGFVPVGIEQPLYSRQHGFAGTPDLYGRLGGNGQVVVVDLKRGAAMAAVALQLSGYAMLLEDQALSFARIIGRYALTRIGSGKARVLPFDQHGEHMADFLAALRLYHNWRRKDLK